MTPIWDELGIQPTRDTRAIRRAYAQRLKTAHPEDDPEAFQRLREAYETALQLGPWIVDDDTVSASEPAAEMSPGGDSPSDPNGKTAPDTLIETGSSEPSAPDRAAALTERVWVVLRDSGEAAAIQEFEEIVRAEDLDQLETRLRVERLLQWGLFSAETMPYLLLERLIEEFQWTTHSVDTGARMLASRLDSWRAYRQLLEAKSFWRPVEGGGLRLPGNPMHARAAAMLAGPCLPGRFKWNRILFPGLSEAVQTRLQHLRLLLEGSLPESLDAKTVAWWDEPGKEKTEHLVPFATTGIFSVVWLAVAINTGLGWKAWAAPTVIMVCWWFGCSFLGTRAIGGSIAAARTHHTTSIAPKTSWGLRPWWLIFAFSGVFRHLGALSEAWPFLVIAAAGGGIVYYFYRKQRE